MTLLSTGIQYAIYTANENMDQGFGADELMANASMDKNTAKKNAYVHSLFLNLYLELAFYFFLPRPPHQSGPIAQSTHKHHSMIPPPPAHASRAPNRHITPPPPLRPLTPSLPPLPVKQAWIVSRRCRGKGQEGAC